MTTINERIEQALSAAGEFSNGFFLVYEGFDATGQRVLHYVYNEDLAYWNASGFLHTALENLDEIMGFGGTVDESDE